MGTAPRRPAHETKACCAQGMRNQTRLSDHRQRPGDEQQRAADDQRRAERVEQPGRRDQQAEQHEQPDLGERGHALGEADAGRPVRQRGVAQDDPAQVDGDEARGVREVDAAEKASTQSASMASG